MFHLDHTLLQIYRLLSETSDISAALPKILDLMIQGSHAERGQIELYDEKGETLFLQARKNGVDIEDRRESKISRKILAWVRENNAIVLSADARQDERFRDSATVWGHNILSVVCAPLRDESRTLGVIYLDNRKREAQFNHQTQELLRELAAKLVVPLKKKLEQQQERQRLTLEIEHLRDRELGYTELIGDSPAMQPLLKEIAFSKSHDENVLILGESGVGKELIARLLHRQSHRGERKFVAVDCSSAPDEILTSELFGHRKGAFTGASQRQRGVVEEAEGGALFLDEIGNLSLKAQTMLLRFLDHKAYRTLGAGEEKIADVRLMFATNSDLAALVQKKAFREDLFFRLKRGSTIIVPPLRERGEDILRLADFFLKKFNQDYKAGIRLSREAGEALQHYSHPGNVRDLETIVRAAARAALKAEQELILPLHLPEEVRSDSGAPTVEISMPIPKFNTDGFYSKFLPKEFQSFHFIWGHPAAEGNDAAADQRLHEQLLIAIKPALDMPLRLTTRAVADAFERNVLIALLERTKGKQRDAIKLTRLHKSAFINKMKKHGITIKKNKFAQGENK